MAPRPPPVTAPGPRGYPLRSRQVTLGDATDDGMTIASAATGLLRKSGPTVPIRLIGVGCTNLLEDVDSTQTTLFHDTRMHKRNALNKTLDRIDDRFGQGTVTRAP